ncbi:Uncharacterised protein [Propionibacterium australiense]|uniref:Lipoprotein n=2 Tax=Propionibacterium australiense TaxID=119981 RepID=A0A383S7M0_9ACTN|nr:Hypothetical protein PROPAUS_1883 [Propionibacterium australiense]VEH90948.1 Uncharacterised protein [Propionibacterium australiense]
MMRTSTSKPSLTRRSVLAAMMGTALLSPLVACTRGGGDGTSGAQNPGDGSADGLQDQLGGLGGNAPSLSPEEYEAIVDGLAEWVSRVWPLMGSVWPDADYNQHRIVAMQVGDDFKATRAWVVSTDGHRELRNDEYADITPPSSYDKITFEGHPSITLNLGSTASLSNGSAPEDASSSTSSASNETGANLKDPATLAFGLMTHELVHFYYQGEINVTAESTRDTPYPFEARPRTLRRMLLNSLYLAATEQDKQQEHLGHARYWLDTWKKEAAQEAQDIHHYDIVEGVARYIEYMALSIDSGQSAEQLRRQQAPLLKEGLTVDISVDAESYALGFPTGVLLDSLKPGWKDGFYASGMTLAELLLDDVTASPDEIDAQVKEEVEKQVAEAEETNGPEIKKIDTAEADTSIAYLRCLEYGEIAYVGSFAYQDKVVLTTTILTLSNSGQNLQIIGAPTFTGADREALNVPLIDVTHSYDNGVLTITGDNITGTIKAERTTENGREVYIAR